MRFLFGGSCFLCRGRADDLTVPTCDADLPRLDFPLCPRCALASPAGRGLRPLPFHLAAYDATLAALAYDFPADALVHALKFRGELASAPLLASLLAERARADAVDHVVAVPLSARRLRERGYNQSAEIARSLRKDLIDLGLCERIRDVRPQIELPYDERQRNVRGAFRCTRALVGARIAVVDDVMTTGATLNEIAAHAEGQRRGVHVVNWVVARHPSLLFDIVLVQPEIPPNTGNVIRLAANTGCSLHLVGRSAFRSTTSSSSAPGSTTTIRDRARARSWAEFSEAAWRHAACTRSPLRANRLYTEVRYATDDVLVFGTETTGLPPPSWTNFPDRDAPADARGQSQPQPLQRRRRRGVRGVAPARLCRTADAARSGCRRAFPRRGNAFSRAFGRWMLALSAGASRASFPTGRSCSRSSPRTPRTGISRRPLGGVRARPARRFLGKHTLFPAPLGWLMRWFGGIPVIRESSQGSVPQVVEVIQREPNIFLAITPAGTRTSSRPWNSGFYHIAHAAACRSCRSLSMASAERSAFWRRSKRVATTKGPAAAARLYDGIRGVKF